MGMAKTPETCRWLPRSYHNCVVDYRTVGTDGFVATVRSNAATDEDLAQWRTEFEQNTHTHWLLRRSYPGLQRLVLRTDFVCQHSSFNKSSSTARATKNSGCSAKMTVKVKLMSRRTKQKDHHVKVMWMFVHHELSC